MKFKFCSLALVTFLAGTITAYASTNELNSKVQKAFSAEAELSTKAYDRIFIDEMTELVELMDLKTHRERLLSQVSLDGLYALSALAPFPAYSSFAHQKMSLMKSKQERTI